MMSKTAEEKVNLDGRRARRKIRPWNVKHIIVEEFFYEYLAIPYARHNSTIEARRFCDLAAVLDKQRAKIMPHEGTCQWNSAQPRWQQARVGLYE